MNHELSPFQLMEHAQVLRTIAAFGACDRLVSVETVAALTGAPKQTVETIVDRLLADRCVLCPSESTVLWPRYRGSEAYLAIACPTPEALAKLYVHLVSDLARLQPRGWQQRVRALLASMRAIGKEELLRAVLIGLARSGKLTDEVLEVVTSAVG